jgi:hypothetical protein
MEKRSNVIHSESEQLAEYAVGGGRFGKRSRSGSTIENVPVRDLTGSSEATSDTLDNNGGDDPLERKENEDESGLTLDLAKKPRRSSCWQHFDQRLIKGTRYAVCKGWNKMLKQVKSAGTGTLCHHIEMHKRNDSNAKKGGQQASIASFQKVVNDPTAI